MIHTAFKNLHISAQIQNITMHEQALLDLYRLATDFPRGYYMVLSHPKNYHGTIKRHNTIKFLVHKLRGTSGKQIVLSLLTNHFPLQN